MPNAATNADAFHGAEALGQATSDWPERIARLIREGIDKLRRFATELATGEASPADTQTDSGAESPTQETESRDGDSGEPGTTRKKSTDDGSNANVKRTAKVLADDLTSSQRSKVEHAQKRATTKHVGSLVKGKISWYGGPHDSQDNDQPASGVPNTVPGIAIMNRSTLGGWWEVTMSNGRTVKLQQTDIGPAKWTGKKIDFNYTAVKELGYTERNFPTGATASARYLGRTPNG